MSKLQPKKIKANYTIQAAGGTITKGSIYDWNPKTLRFEYKVNNDVVSFVSPMMVETMSHIFQKIYE